jgi:hypothetical protein
MVVMALLYAERHPYYIATFAADVRHVGHRYSIINIADHVRNKGV